MIVTAWNNGSHFNNGNGYGIKISSKDRDQYFRREWRVIILELEGEEKNVEVNIAKDSFWNSTCRELISVRIGKWLIKKGFAPWPTGQPPELELRQTRERYFYLTKKDNYA